MPYKPVGIDENSHFPPRVQAALAEKFVTIPDGISDGQVPVWNAKTKTWVSGIGGNGASNWVLPPAIDGGSWDSNTNTWSVSTWAAPADTVTPPGPPAEEIDGGTPSSI